MNTLIVHVGFTGVTNEGDNVEEAEKGLKKASSPECEKRRQWVQWQQWLCFSQLGLFAR